MVRSVRTHPASLRRRDRDGPVLGRLEYDLLLADVEVDREAAPLLVERTYEVLELQETTVVPVSPDKSR